MIAFFAAIGVLTCASIAGMGLALLLWHLFSGRPAPWLISDDEGES